MNKRKCRNSNANCCVAGCKNAYYNTDTAVKFYGFPNRWYEKERKAVWINAIKGACEGDGRKFWQPGPQSKVCSYHFVGGEKSNHPLNPAYNPTIFRRVLEKGKTVKEKSQLDRLSELLVKANGEELKLFTLENDMGQCMDIKQELEEHHLEQKQEKLQLFPLENIITQCVVIKQELEEYHLQDFGCQTELEIDNSGNNFIFECNFSRSGDVAVQANVGALRLVKS